MVCAYKITRVTLHIVEHKEWNTNHWLILNALLVLHVLWCLTSFKVSTMHVTQREYTNDTWGERYIVIILSLTPTSIQTVRYHKFAQVRCLLRICVSREWGHAWGQLNGVELDKNWWVTCYVRYGLKGYYYADYDYMRTVLIRSIYIYI